MVKNKITNNGFSAIAVVLIIALLGIIGGIGYYVWQNSQTNTTEQSNETIQSTTANSNNESTKSNVSLKKGIFKGVGTKTGSGSVSLIEKNKGVYSVKLEEDFSVQKGPALYVAFGNRQTYAKGTAFAELKSFTGSQEYEIPSNIKVTSYDSILIWCEEFSVAFSVAELK